MMEKKKTVWLNWLNKGLFLALAAGITMFLTVIFTGGMDADGVISQWTIGGVSLAGALLVGAFVAMFFAKFE